MQLAVRTVGRLRPVTMDVQGDVVRVDAVVRSFGFPVEAVPHGEAAARAVAKALRQGVAPDSATQEVEVKHDAWAPREQRREQQGRQGQGQGQRRRKRKEKTTFLVQLAAATSTGCVISANRLLQDATSPEACEAAATAAARRVTPPAMTARDAWPGAIPRF